MRLNIHVIFNGSTKIKRKTEGTEGNTITPRKQLNKLVVNSRLTVKQ